MNEVRYDVFANRAIELDVGIIASIDDDGQGGYIRPVGDLRNWRDCLRFEFNQRRRLLILGSGPDKPKIEDLKNAPQVWVPLVEPYFKTAGVCEGLQVIFEQRVEAGVRCVGPWAGWDESLYSLTIPKSEYYVIRNSRMQPVWAGWYCEFTECRINDYGVFPKDVFAGKILQPEGKRLVAVRKMKNCFNSLRNATILEQPPARQRTTTGRRTA
jgi:hypothetical protein